MSDKSHPLCSTVVLTILRLLSRSAFMTASELSRRLSAEGVSVQLRTLQKTLKTMSETPVYGVERNVDHKSYSYRLAAPVTLASTKLSPRDALLMRLSEESLAAALLLRLSDDDGEEAQEVLNERFERLKDREARRRVAVIPDLPLLTPPRLLPEVLDAVATALFRNAKLDFTYRDEGNGEHRLVASPLGVVHHCVRIHLFYLAEDGKVRHVPLHRLTAAEVLAEPAVRPKNFLLAQAAKTLPVPQDGRNPVRLSLTFTNPTLARMLAETPFGPHQRIVRAGAKKFVLSVILPDSPRIYAWIALWKETGGITNATVEPLAKKSE